MDDLLFSWKSSKDEKDENVSETNNNKQAEALKAMIDELVKERVAQEMQIRDHRIKKLKDKVHRLEMVNDHIEKRLAETEGKLGVDSTNCLIPWRNLTSRRDGIIGELPEDAERPDDIKNYECFNLSEDVYSILACWEWKTLPFLIALFVVFGEQITLLTLLIVDQVQKGENPLQIWPAPKHNL